MSKKVLILVLSSDFAPYSEMIETSRRTWDAEQVQNSETIFYCSSQDNPEAVNHDNVMYFDVDNSLYDMGYKNLAMFEWALANKEFDYVARINASCYCDKKRLMEYVEELPKRNVFCGVVVTETPAWCFGGTNFVISKDVIQEIVRNKSGWQHEHMEDRAMSYLVGNIGIPFTNGIKSCSIDRDGDNWQCISYCGKSKSFSDFNDLKDLGHVFYRVKCDGQRWVDKMLMEQLKQVLQ